MRSRSLTITALVAAAAMAPACKEAPPAYPSAVVYIDTDVPVPTVISRLQIDVFDEAGRWSDHHRFAFTQARDWPVSFGVYLRDDARSTKILVRVRGYADGGERDYRGEHPASVDPYTPRAYPQSLAELCSAATTLPPFEARRFLVGPKPLFDTTCDKLDNYSGSAAALVDIPSAGSYRFEILPALGSNDTTSSIAPSLHLVASCLNPGTTLGCDTELDSKNNVVARIVKDLSPGRYALVTGSAFPGSVGEVTLRWAPADQWGSPVIPAPDVQPPEELHDLRLVRDGVDGTPTVEPSPEATVDRLVRLELVPGAPAEASVVLRGACAGASAKLAFKDTGAVDLDASTTCIDDPKSFVAAPLASGASGAPAKSAVGTFLVDPCTEADSDDEHVCVPGGAFLQGGSLPPFPEFATEGPPRITAVKRFFLDRHEYTVKRYRAAVARGLSLDAISPLHPPQVNDGPITEGDDTKESTFSTKPMGREDFPLTGIMNDAARRICAFEGGSLPTEAQWERAAGYSTLGVKRVYPWGDTPATCKRTVVSRSATLGNQCRGTFPVAVGDGQLADDAGDLGIVGLGGNVSEHVVGSALPYDHPCFRGAGVVDPVCEEPTYPQGLIRGGSWETILDMTRGSMRRTAPITRISGDVGFRCAYTSLPETR